MALLIFVRVSDPNPKPQTLNSEPYTTESEVHELCGRWQLSSGEVFVISKLAGAASRILGFRFTLSLRV